MTEENQRMEEQKEVRPEAGQKEREKAGANAEAETEGRSMSEPVQTAGKERRGFLQDNTGVGVVEIILILVVLIALVLIFKDQLTGMVEKAMAALEKSMEGILS
ncbi:MAG: Flp1 family type IVb pilin [Lachnospiraceae bacterium]